MRRSLLARGLDYLQRLVRRKEIEFVLRGKPEHRPMPGKRAVMWLISQADSLTDAELRLYDHVFVASQPFLAQVAARCRSSSLLLQCTDADRFSPGDRAGGDAVLFVGNRRAYAPRPVVQAALDAGVRPVVWGKGWDGVLPDGVFAGEHVANEDLHRHYRKAAVVLNDHTDDMLKNGFVSNRVYDVLACGAAILTEDMPGIPDDLRPHMLLYRTAADVGPAIARALDQAQSGSEDRLRVARHVRQSHGFAARAKDILTMLERLAAW
jgi:hypothetical protein